jgi:hypothetical protein
MYQVHLDKGRLSNTTLLHEDLTKGGNQTHPKPGRSKTGFGQVKIMKEFVWINRTFFLNMAFGQVGEKNYGKDCNVSHGGDISIHRLFFQWASTMKKIQLCILV